MTESHRGMFFHGDRDEFQCPRYSVQELEEMVNDKEVWFAVEEISPEQVLEELKGWSDGLRAAKKIIDRHLNDADSPIIVGAEKPE